MAKDAIFVSGLKELRKSIKDKVSELQNLEDTLTEKICKTFVQRSRDRLLQKANTDQLGLIQSLLGNIYYRPAKSGYQIIVRNDEEGLMMFLEYGTGLQGEAYRHPQASMVGWEYAMNVSDYKNFQDKSGWFFQQRDNNYVDREDITIERRTSTAVFSQGIKPVRYIYDTWLEIQDVIRRSRGDYNLLMKMLDQLLGKGIEKEIY